MESRSWISAPARVDGVVGIGTTSSSHPAASVKVLGIRSNCSHTRGGKGQRTYPNAHISRSATVPNINVISCGWCESGQGVGIGRHRNLDARPQCESCRSVFDLPIDRTTRDPSQVNRGGSRCQCGQTAGLRTSRRLVHRKIIDGYVHLIVEAWIPARYKPQLNTGTDKGAEVDDLLKPWVGIRALLCPTDQRNTCGRSCALHKDFQLIDQTAEHMVPKTQFRRRQGAQIDLWRKDLCAQDVARIGFRIHV